MTVIRKGISTISNNVTSDLVMAVRQNGKKLLFLYLVEKTFSMMFSTINVVEKCQTHLVNSFLEKIIIKHIGASVKNNLEKVIICFKKNAGQGFSKKGDKSSGII